MDFSIFTKFSAIDNMTAPMGKMGAKVSLFQKNLKATQRDIKGITDGMGGKWIERGLLAGAVGLGYAFKKATDEAGKFQAVSTSFIPPFAAYGKSAKEASEFTGWLNEEAIATAYTFEGLADAAKRLFPNLKGDTQKTIKTLKMFEDAAGGNIEKLDTLAQGYTKGLLRGKFDMRSLNMIAEAGVPIYQELAKSMFGSVDATAKVFKASRAGAISLQFVEKAFENMTSKGGIFYGSAGLYATTFAGQMDILGESINTVWRELGNALIPALQELYPYITGIIDTTKQWLIANKEMIKSEFKSFLTGVIDAFKWIYNNWGAITTGLKIWIGLWAGMTAVNFILGVTQTLITGIGIMLGAAAPILVGVAILAGAWLSVRDNTSEASFYVDEYGKKIDVANNKVDGLGKKIEVVNLKSQVSFTTTWASIVDTVLYSIQQILNGMSYFGGSVGNMASAGATSIANTRRDNKIRENEANGFGRKQIDQKSYAASISSIFSMPTEDNTAWSGRGLGFALPAASPSFLTPSNIDAQTKTQKSTTEIVITTDKGTEAKVLNQTGAKSVFVTLNNSNSNSPQNYYTK